MQQTGQQSRQCNRLDSNQDNATDWTAIKTMQQTQQQSRQCNRLNSNQDNATDWTAIKTMQQTGQQSRQCNRLDSIMTPPWAHRALAEQCGAHDAGLRWWPPGPPDPPDQVTYLEWPQWQRSCLGEGLLLAMLQPCRWCQRKKARLFLHPALVQ